VVVRVANSTNNSNYTWWRLRAWGQKRKEKKIKSIITVEIKNICILLLQFLSCSIPLLFFTPLSLSEVTVVAHCQCYLVIISFISWTLSLSPLGIVCIFWIAAGRVSCSGRHSQHSSWFPLLCHSYWRDAGCACLCT